MKKLAILLSALIVALCCVSCATTPNTLPEIDSPLPWLAYITLSSEKCTYDVTKYYVDSNGNKYQVTDNSSHLEFYLESTGDSEHPLYTLTSNLKIEYLSDVESSFLPVDFKGKTDSIYSKAVFNKDLSAVSSEKEAIINTAQANSYYFTANYSTGKTSFAVSKSEYEAGNVTKEFSFSPKTFYDNEYLYYYIRSMKGINNTSAYLNFNIVNWYECYINDKFQTLPLIATNQTTEGVNVNIDGFLDYFEDVGKDTDTNAVSCSHIDIALGGDLLGKGKALEAFYTTHPYRKDVNGRTTQTQKILTKMVNYEYNEHDGVTYVTEYVLSDFKTEFKSN